MDMNGNDFKIGVIYNKTDILLEFHVDAFVFIIETCESTHLHCHRTYNNIMAISWEEYHHRK